MEERIAKDRELLLIFSLLWVGSTLWALRYYPIIKNFDFSKLNPSQLNILFIISLANIFSIVMSSIYFYKMCKWYNSPNFPPKLMTFIFVVSALILGLIAVVLVILIFWKTKKLIIEDNKV